MQWTISPRVWGLTPTPPLSLQPHPLHLSGCLLSHHCSAQGLPTLLPPCDDTLLPRLSEPPPCLLLTPILRITPFAAVWSLFYCSTTLCPGQPAVLCPLKVASLLSSAPGPGAGLPLCPGCAYSLLLAWAPRWMAKVSGLGPPFLCSRVLCGFSVMVALFPLLSLASPRCLLSNYLCLFIHSASTY